LAAQQGLIHLPGTLLDQADSLVLKAVSHRGEAASKAYRAWRALSSLEDAKYHHHQAFALLAEVAEREGLVEPALARMRGVGRHYWTNNQAKRAALRKALTALNSRAIQPMVLSGLALACRLGAQKFPRPLGALELLVRNKDIAAACQALSDAGFSPKGPALSIDGALLGSAAGALVLTHPAHTEYLWLRTRPDARLFADSVLAALWEAASLAQVEGCHVQVPSLEHQLFIAMARGDGIVPAEYFANMLEASALLALAKQPVDWPALTVLANDAGVARAFCAASQTLAAHTPFPVPSMSAPQQSGSRAIGVFERVVRTLPLPMVLLRFLALRRWSATGHQATTLIEVEKDPVRLRKQPRHWALIGPRKPGQTELNVTGLFPDTSIDLKGNWGGRSTEFSLAGCEHKIVALPAGRQRKARANPLGLIRIILDELAQ
jgi:hypothetical protein